MAERPRRRVALLIVTGLVAGSVLLGTPAFAQGLECKESPEPDRPLEPPTITRRTSSRATLPHRTRWPRASIAMSAAARRAVRNRRVAKGDPLQAARIAGIMAAKRTSELIPLCHPLPLSVVDVSLEEATAELKLIDPELYHGVAEVFFG